MESKMVAGTIVTLIGLSILGKALFKFDIPLMRIALGLFFVYLGAKFIMGERSWKWTEFHAGTGSSALFSNLNLKINEGEKPLKDYSSVFGSATIDLTNVSIENEDVEIEINAIFGSTRLIIAPSTPVEVQASSIFGHAQLPDDSQIAIGRQTYRSESTKTSKHRLIIKSNTIFGSFELVQK